LSIAKAQTLFSLRLHERQGSTAVECLAIKFGF